MRPSLAGMRWNNLFDDLESQLERELTAEEVDLQAEDERLRLGRLGMRDRIVALQAVVASTGPVRVTLRGGDRVLLRPVTVGRDWFSADLAERPGQVLVPLDAVASLTLARDQVSASLSSNPSATAEHPTLSERLGLPFVLRDLCRRRRAIELVLADSVVHGTIDRVGRDHVDIAMHEPGMPRRESAVTEYRVVPLAALQLVRL